MVLLAVVSSGIAASFYPWPEQVVESEMVGEPLFESYDTTAVRSIEIEKFNTDKNEIENLIDTMIESGDELVDNLKTVLPNSLSESMVMFHESHVANLKKIKEFLNP